jgi:hypothetical protein
MEDAVRRVGLVSAIAVLLSVFAPAASPATAAATATPAPGGVAAGRAWTVWEWEPRYGGWYDIGRTFRLTLSGVFEFGGRTWNGEVPMRVSRVWGMHTNQPKVESATFTVRNFSGHTLSGKCTPLEARLTLILSCKGSIDGGPQTRHRLQLTFPVDVPLGIDTQPVRADGWFGRGVAHVVVGRFAITQ